MSVSAFPLDPASYQSHALHRGERAWIETNCYVDLWIELIHARGLDPTAALPFTVALDFEGDQWLFFKQPTADLELLYGVDVQELAIWRPLLLHAEEQLSRGNVVLVEVDAWNLPDTQGVSYRSAHTKTTIGIQNVDREARRLGYFHNAGYFTLAGADFAALFGLDAPHDPAALVPYTEFVKFGRLQRLPDEELARRSIRLLGKHLARRPATNPVERFATRFHRDLEWLKTEPPARFHEWAFVTLRQLGACSELCASYLKWLAGRGESGLEPLVAEFETLASTAKTVQFKGARAALAKKPVDFEPMLLTMKDAWARGTSGLEARYAGT